MALLTLPSIPVRFFGDTHLRSDMVALVYDNAEVSQPFVPATGASWTLAPGTATYDSVSDTTGYDAVLGGVPPAFSPGKVQFSFSGDATIRPTEWESLAGPFIAALISENAQSVPSAFITPTDVTNLLSSVGLALPTNADVGIAIDAAVDVVQDRTGRAFGTGLTSARRYDSYGTEYLPIDACSSITLVEELSVDGVILESMLPSDNVWLAYPLNGTVYTGLRRISGWPFRVVAWTRGAGAVRVTATFGETPPPALVLAMRYLAALDLCGASIAAAAGGIVEWHQEPGRGETWDPKFYRVVLDQWAKTAASALRLKRHLVL